MLSVPLRPQRLVWQTMMGLRVVWSVSDKVSHNAVTGETIQWYVLFFHSNYDHECRHSLLNLFSLEFVGLRHITSRQSVHKDDSQLLPAWLPYSLLLTSVFLPFLFFFPVIIAVINLIFLLLIRPNFLLTFPPFHLIFCGPLPCSFELCCKHIFLLLIHLCCPVSDFNFSPLLHPLLPASLTPCWPSSYFLSLSNSFFFSPAVLLVRYSPYLFMHYLYFSSEILCEVSTLLY